MWRHPAQKTSATRLSKPWRLSYGLLMPQEPAEDEDGLRAARGKLIRSERGRQGLTQQELATLAGIGRAHLALIEKGTRGLSETKLRAIAKALGIKEARLRN